MKFTALRVPTLSLRWSGFLQPPEMNQRFLNQVFPHGGISRQPTGYSRQKFSRLNIVNQHFPLTYTLLRSTPCLPHNECPGFLTRATHTGGTLHHLRERSFNFPEKSERRRIVC